MVDESAIRKAADLLLQAAPPGSKVVLFGSYARGQAGPHSDLDSLVIEPTVRSAAREMVRLREAVDPVLGPFRIGVDVLVVGAETFEYWRETPNTLYYRAVKEGKTYGQVA